MKNILIVADMQKGFVKDKETIEVSKKIKELMKSGIFDTVIATCFINGNDSIYEKLVNWDSLKSDDETMLVDGYTPLVDFVITRGLYTCVNADFIELLCQCNSGIYPTNVFIVGVDTECSVLSIAKDLFERHMRPIVLSNYCFSNGGLKSHEAGLLCLEHLIGSNQVVSKEITNRQDLNAI